MAAYPALFENQSGINQLGEFWKSVADSLRSVALKCIKQPVLSDQEGPAYLFFQSRALDGSMSHRTFLTEGCPRSGYAIGQG